MARPLRPNPPFPLKPNGRVLFSLMARPFTTPPPLLMAQPLREELFLRPPLAHLEKNFSIILRNGI